MSEEQNEQFHIEHRAADTRYVLIDTQADGAPQIGEIDYVDVAADPATQRVLFHTGVSEEYGGQGLASRLVRYAVDDALAGGQRIVAVCPYVKKWLEKHDEFADHVDSATPAHLNAIPGRN